MQSTASPQRKACCAATAEDPYESSVLLGNPQELEACFFTFLVMARLVVGEIFFWEQE